MNEQTGTAGPDGDGRNKRPVWLRMMKSRWVADRPVLAYGLAVAIFLVAFEARILADPVLPTGFPYLTFFPAVIVTTFLCGLFPGILCAILSFGAAWYVFIEPRYSIQLSGAAVVALLFYIFIVSIDIALIHAMRLAAIRIEKEQETVEDLLARQNVMFQELQHRVANNMQFISSLLVMQKRKVETDSAAAEILDDARMRIDTIGRIHRRLYDPERASMPASMYLNAVCADVLEAAGRDRITFAVEAPDVRFNLTQLTALALLVAELATNAVKHAYKPEEAGTLVVSLDQLEGERWRLTVADGGRGLPEGFDPGASRSLGLRIVQGLARQLGGEIRFETDGGTRARVEFTRA